MEFNENTLREHIVRVWGEHGAHVDVLDTLIADWRRKSEALSALVEADAAAYQHEQLCHEQPCTVCFDNSGRIEDAYSRARGALGFYDERDDSITGLAEWIADRLTASRH